ERGTRTRRGSARRPEKTAGNRRAPASRWPESFPTAPRSGAESRRRVFDSLRAPAYHSPRVMATYLVESRVWLARARPDVFSFFAAAENLVLLTPPAFRLAIVAGPPALSAGAVVDLRMSWLGVAVGWRGVIPAGDP